LSDFFQGENSNPGALTGEQRKERRKKREKGQGHPSGRPCRKAQRGSGHVGAAFQKSL